MKMTILRAVLIPAFLTATSMLRAEVKVWELPEGKPASLETRTDWKEADASSRFTAGAAVENEWLTVLIRAGSAGPVVRTKTGNAGAGTAILAENGAAGTVTQVRMGDCDMMEAILLIKAGSSEFNLVVRSGGTYIGLVPVTNAVRLELKAPAKYAVMPNFHGADTVNCAATNKGESLSLEPKPMLVEFLQGSDGILGLIWDGGVGEKDGKKNDKKTWEPRRIELRAIGEGTARMFETARIEFKGKPLYVGILSGKNVWQEIPKADSAALKPAFSAVWRTNSIAGGDSVVLHPFDRTEKTPLDKFAVEDLLRQSLGTGPCELDWWRPMLR